MPPRRKPLHWLIPFVFLLVLACGPCSFLSRQSPTPPHDVVLSAESADQLEARLRQSLGSPSGQQFILRMTDGEVTSLLAQELAKADESPVTNPVVWFTNGKLYATGRLANVIPIAADISLIASPRIEDGQVSIRIERLSAGDVRLPSSVADMISRSINETVDELQLDVEITDLEILEGEAIIRGIRR